jgi:hypothetical protein
MRKGQEEAPIELLLAVTLLTFVIIIGLYTYQNMCTSMYEDKLKSSLSTFSGKLTTIYQGGVGTADTVPLDLSESGCSLKIESVRLLKGLEDSCRREYGRVDCMEMIVVTKDPSGSSILMKQMIDIPYGVTIRFENAPETCKDLNTIPFNSWIDPGYADCGWGARAYSLWVKKDSSTLITIEQS